MYPLILETRKHFCTNFTDLFPGFMFDAFGTYNEGLVLMGVMIALSGLMLYPIPCIKNFLAKVIYLTKHTTHDIFMISVITNT